MILKFICRCYIIRKQFQLSPELWLLCYKFASHCKPYCLLSPRGINSEYSRILRVILSFGSHPAAEPHAPELRVRQSALRHRGAAVHAQDALRHGPVVDGAGRGRRVRLKGSTDLDLPNHTNHRKTLDIQTGHPTQSHERTHKVSISTLN